jgi:hypothetical protein
LHLFLIGHIAVTRRTKESVRLTTMQMGPPPPFCFRGVASNEAILRISIATKVAHRACMRMIDGINRGWIEFKERERLPRGAG